MAGSSRSAAALAEIAVQVEIGHVVSYGSMVSRAYLTDRGAGIIVDVGEPWLIAPRSLLLPDPEQLKLRAEREQGIPGEHGNVRLMKVAFSWSGGAAEVKTPEVIAGELGAAAITLNFPASLPGRIRSPDGPQFVTLGDDLPLALGDAVGVVVTTPDGPVVRWGRVASDPGFGGVAGAVALGVGLASGATGSPAYRFGDDDVAFCGLADPIDATTARLLPPTAIRDLIRGDG